MIGLKQPTNLVQQLMARQLRVNTLSNKPTMPKPMISFGIRRPGVKL